jgi:hypothetical protein
VTLIRTSAKVPTFALVGVPASAPVPVLKLAQEGMLTIEKLRLSPVGAVTTGMKLKAWPAVTLAGGVPLIVGGTGGSEFSDFDNGRTVMRNGPTVAWLVPSETTIWISGVVPTSLGVRDSGELTIGLAEGRPVGLVRDRVGKRASVGVGSGRQVLILGACPDRGRRHTVDDERLRRCARRAVGCRCGAVCAASCECRCDYGAAGKMQDLGDSDREFLRHP